VNAGAYDRLQKAIDDVCTYDLGHAPRALYLLLWRGDWLIASNPQHGARLIGWFDDGCKKSQLQYAVYAAVNKARPG
jgi:hypothetical protein